MLSADYSTDASAAAEQVPAALSVVILDDQSSAREILAAIVHVVDPSAVITKFEDPMECIGWASSNVADFVLTDLRMPKMDGVEVIRVLRALPHCADTPIVVVSGIEDRPTRYLALEVGATDFLSKPIDHHECMVRCRNLLTMRRQQLLLKDRARHLQHQVEEATAEIRGREMEALLMLAKAGEHRDSETGNHVLRVSRVSGLLARQVGHGQPHLVESSSLLHDIGKIGIPDRILLKPERLTESEMIVIREHTTIGASILGRGKSDLLRMGSEIALSHHERYDGTGYPNGLRGEDIPLSGRIVAVADTLDALLSHRPYKMPWTREETVSHLVRESGTHFDPNCVKALVEDLPAVFAVFDELLDK